MLQGWTHKPTLKTRRPRIRKSAWGAGEEITKEQQQQQSARIRDLPCGACVRLFGHGDLIVRWMRFGVGWDRTKKRERGL